MTCNASLIVWTVVFFNSLRLCGRPQLIGAEWLFQTVFGV